MSDFLKTKRDEIAARLRELEPLVDEYRQLEAASAALAGLPGAAARAPRTERRTRATATRTTTRSRRSSTTGRRGRPRGSGTRAIQTLELVKSKPGITIPEIASAMGIKQNYLYRVLPGLEKDGKVVKRDRGWHAAA
ncbi:MAG TPA: hypothetical protein VFC22_07185 [Solirubrobacteraceae bacterium]|nr:hypothetical protein [Solirubrobacteraceae bacterium]